MALAAGGRYDSLAKILGKRDIPAVGGAIGINRVVMEMQDKKSPKPKEHRKYSLSNSAVGKTKKHGYHRKFRLANIYIAQSISKDNLNSQLSLASRMNVPYVLMLGQKEVLENSIIIRDMSIGAQETVPIEKVVEIIKKKIGIKK